MGEFITESVGAAWRSRGFAYAILEGAMRLLLRLSIIRGIFLTIYAFGGRLFDVDVLRRVGLLWAGIALFLSCVWWIFTASCRVASIHAYSDGVNGYQGKREWLKDLPAVMGIEAGCGVIRMISLAAVILGFYDIFKAEYGLGLLAISCGGMVLLVLSILEPVIVTERIAGGDGVIKSICAGVREFVRMPAEALGVCFLPGIVVMTCHAAGIWEMYVDHGFVMVITMIVAAIISLIQPVFWVVYRKKALAGAAI